MKKNFFSKYGWHQPWKKFLEAIKFISWMDRKSVTVFCDPISNPTCRIRITRIHRIKRNDIRHEFAMSYGRPNYAEREFLKSWKKRKLKPIEFFSKEWPKKRK